MQWNIEIFLMLITLKLSGYVYDRNRKLLVANQPSYDVMIIPREVEDLQLNYNSVETGELNIIFE